MQQRLFLVDNGWRRKNFKIWLCNGRHLHLYVPGTPRTGFWAIAQAEGADEFCPSDQTDPDAESCHSRVDNVLPRGLQHVGLTRRLIATSSRSRLLGPCVAIPTRESGGW